MPDSGGTRGSLEFARSAYVGASNQFGPLPQLLFGPRDGTGVEIYYDAQINPWLNVTPDMQFIRPEAGALTNDAFIYGVRVNRTL